MGDTRIASGDDRDRCRPVRPTNGRLPRPARCPVRCLMQDAPADDGGVHVQGSSRVLDRHLAGARRNRMKGRARAHAARSTGDALRSGIRLRRMHGREQSRHAYRDIDRKVRGNQRRRAACAGRLSGGGGLQSRRFRLSAVSVYFLVQEVQPTPGLFHSLTPVESIRSAPFAACSPPATGVAVAVKAVAMVPAPAMVVPAIVTW